MQFILCNYWTYFIGLAATYILHRSYRNWNFTGLAACIFIYYSVSKKSKTFKYTKSRYSGVDVVHKDFPKFILPWRNLPNRNYTPQQKYSYNKNTYYQHF
jgi:hypothetical protein